ncbi:GGDEF domain-containing protein, partial [Psychromonas antarctica]|nr:GGDEF domain-containing protein [Psychromonas antarctica]
MGNFNKKFWVSNIIVLLFAILLTVAIKFIFNILLLQQQESLSQQLKLREMAVITDTTQLNNLVESNLFN